MRRLAIPFLILASLTAAAASAVAADAGPLFLWRAEKDGAVVHLLGSIHAGQADFFPLDERIYAALAASDTVACEIDLTDPAMQMKVAMLVQQQGMYPADQSLQDHLPQATWQNLVQHLDGVVPSAILERMRPGLAAVMVTQVTMVQAGLDEQFGIDRHILDEAKEQDKPIVALETVEDQVALLFGPDAALDALMLTESLEDDAEAMLDQMKRLIEYWLTGDAEGMQHAYEEEWLDHETMQRFHEDLLVRRNHAMAERLMDRRGRWFVVVGALHLCGDIGVPALLAEAGWQVEQAGALVAQY